MKTKKSLIIFGIFAIALAIAGVFVYAQTQSEMQNELNNLISDLNSEGYSWLIDYSVEDNLGSCNYISIIENISEEGFYKTYLTGLNGTSNVFDLKVLSENGIEFDYIVDPIYLNLSTNATNTNVTYENNFSHLNISDADILLYANADENVSSITTYDYSNNSFDGTFYNGSKIIDGGIIGYAYNFSSASQEFIDFSYDASLQLQSGGAISFWFNPTVTINSGLAADIYPVEMGERAGTDSGWYFRFLASNGALILTSEPSNNVLTSSTTTWTAGTWYHVVATFIDGNGYLYVNGVLQNTGVFTNPTISGDYQEILTIGGHVHNGNTWGNFYDGSIDELMIFDKNLTSTDVANIHNFQYQKFFPTGEITFENLDFGTNNTVNISIPNCQQLNGSQLSFKINDRDYQNFSGCSFTDYEFQPTGSDNFSVKFLSMPFNFYSPLVIGNISLEDYETDKTSPTINFEEPPTPSNNSYTKNSATIIANISDNSEGNTSSFIDFDNSLVSYWMMGDYYNSTGIFDNSTYSNFGTFNGGLSSANISDGMRGDGLSFDGVNDYVDLGTYTDLEGVSEFTISVWAYKEEDGNFNGYDGVFAMGSDGQRVPWIWGNSGSTSLSGYFETNATSNDCVASHLGLVANAWNHIVFTWNSTHCWFVVNDVKGNIDSTTLGSVLANTDGDNYIGKMAGYDTWNGSIDEVLIFNRSLSQSEISALYDSKANKFNASFSSLDSGQHNYSVYAIDEAGNLNISDLRNFNVDETFPQINFESPTPSNNSYTKNSATIIANISDNSEGSTSSFINFDNSLVGYWNFDNTNSTGIFDNSSNNNFGTFNGGLSSVDISDGMRGDGLSFDGVNDYVDCGNDESLNITEEITVGAWVNLRQADTFDWIVASSSSASAVDGFMLFKYNEYLRFSINSYNANSAYFTFPDFDQWIFVVGTYDKNAVSNQINIYVNGVKGTSDSYTSDIAYPTNWRVDIGFLKNSYQWNGSIDEVMVFNRSLSTDEISALYDSKVNKFNASFSSLDAGQHNYSVYAIDEAGNLNVSDLRNFVVDTSVPSVVINSPANNSYFSSNVKFDVDVSDSSGEPTYTFINDSSVVGYWTFDSTNSTGVFDTSGQCYDNETEILTENGWKYFYELEDNEEVATLNSETGELEWEVPIDRQEFDNENEMYKIVLEDGSDLLVSEKHKVYSNYLNKLSGYEINLNKEITNNFPLNSDDLTCLSNFDRSEKAVSINGGVNFNTTIPECSFGGNNLLLRKCLSNVNITLDSDLANFESCLSVKPDGTFLISCPCSFNSSSIFLGMFSSERNFNLLEENISFFTNEFRGIGHNRKDSGLCNVWKVICKNFINADTCSEQFQNLPDHNSGSFECGNSVANFSVHGDIFIDVNSHEKEIEDEIFKSFSLQQITEVYSSFVSGENIYFLDENNKPIKVKSISKENYNGKIYDVDVENDIVLVRRNINEDNLNEKENMNSIGFVVVSEENESNDFFVFINNEFENEIFGDVDSSFTSEIISQGFVVERILDNFSDFVFKDFFEEGIFPAEFVNSSFTLFFYNGSIAHFSNISSTELNLMNLPSFNTFFNSSICSGLGGSSSTGCQSICSQNSQSSSVSSLVCLNLSDMSRFINLITDATNNLESNCKSSSDNLSNSAIQGDNLIQYKNLSVSNKKYLDVGGKLIDVTGALWSGNSNFGTFNGGLGQSNLSQGKFGDGLSFDGVNDYVDCGNPSNIFDFGTNDFTISWWMKGNHVAAITKYSNLGGFGFIFPLNNNSLYFRDGTDALSLTSSVVFLDDNLKNVVTKRNATGFYVYVNGVQTGFNAGASIDSLSHSGTPLRLGTAHLNGGYWASYGYNGSIDEVLIFNRSLSTDEIKALYNSSSQKFNVSYALPSEGENLVNLLAVDSVANTNLTTLLLNNDLTFPQINFESPTPSNNSYTKNSATIIANISDTSNQNTSSWIDFDNSLVGYWSMGDYYNSTGIFDNSSYDNFGSFNGGLSSANISDGMRGDGLEFDGDNDYVDLGDNVNFNFGTGNFSYSIYVKTADDVTNTQSVFIKGIPSNDNVYGYQIFISGGNFQITSSYSSSHSDLGGIQGQYLYRIYHPVTTNTQYHLFVNVDRNNEVTLYVDGISVASQTINDGTRIGTTVSQSYPLRFGTRSHTLSSFFKGTLDEVMIFNRSLSQSEISALYDSKANKFNASFSSLDSGQHNYSVYAIDEAGNLNISDLRNFVVDTIAPTYSLNQTNNTITGQSTLFSLYVNDETALETNGQYIFSTNNTGVWINDSAVNFTSTPSWANVTKVLNSTGGISIGYQWYLTDNVGNENNTEVFVLTTTSSDSTPPEVVINSPLNQSYNTDSILFNVTATDDNSIDECLYSLDGLTNVTMTNIAGTDYYNATNSSMTEGSHNVTFYCNDSSGNLNLSLVYFIVDRTAPQVTIALPVSGQTFTTSSVTFQVTTNENSTCDYSINGFVINSSMTANSAGTIHESSATLSNANYIVNYSCSDLAENFNSSEGVSFTVSVSSGGGGDSPGGGGGSSGGGFLAVVAEPDFSVDISTIEKTLALNRIELGQIGVNNEKNVSRTFTARVEVLNSIILFDESSIVIEGNSRGEFDFRMTPPSEPGTYTGKIIISSGGLEIQIPVIINVRTEKSLYDIILTIPKSQKILNLGESLTSQIDLLQMGIKEKMDVTLNYAIKDFGGKIYLTQSETIAVENQKTLQKEFDTHDLHEGDYVLSVELIYPDGVAVASSQFKIGTAGIVSENILIKILVIVALVGLIAVIFFATKKYRKWSRRLNGKK